MSDSSRSQQEGQRQEAERLWEQAFGIVKEGRYQTAIEILLRARHADPTFYWSWLSLGECYSAIEAYDSAVECYREALKLHLPNDRIRASVFTGLAHALNDAGRRSEAEFYFRTGAEIWPQASAFCALGALYVNLKRHGEAEQVLRYALELEPDFDEAMYFLSIALRRTGRIDDAIGMARAAIDRDSNCARYYLELGLLMRMKGRYEESEFTLRKSIQLCHTEHQAHVYLADLFYCQDRHEEAIEQWKLAAEVGPDHSLPYRRLGVLYEEMGRPSDAEQAYRRAVEISPDDADALFKLGTILVSLGKEAEAKPHLRKFLALCPNDQDAPYVRRLLGHDPGE